MHMLTLPVTSALVFAFVLFLYVLPVELAINKYMEVRKCWQGTMLNFARWLLSADIVCQLPQSKLRFLPFSCLPNTLS